MQYREFPPASIVSAAQSLGHYWQRKKVEEVRHRDHRYLHPSLESFERPTAKLVYQDAAR